MPGSQRWRARGPATLNLVFTAQPDGSLQGTVTFGRTPAAPLDTPDSGRFIDAYNMEGFPYAALFGSFDGWRLRFKVKSWQVYKAWCEKQTSYPAGRLGICPWYCYPAWPASGQGLQPNEIMTFSNPDGGPNVIFDDFGSHVCVYAYPPICSCLPTGCTVSMCNPDIAFDMVVQAGRMDGSVFLSPPFNVHLRSVASPDAHP
jgi:hypothetical protein